ncbi:MAG: hypothetical protein ABI234_03830 [Ktedonobacteraceae bacterium]
MFPDDLETAACVPYPVDAAGFNPAAVIPYGCGIAHIQAAMNDFVDFLGFINQQLHVKSIERLETILMPANFSSMVGEFMNSSIPKYCTGVVKNTYHNGHPDLLPAGRFPGNAAQYGNEGIEIKGSRYLKGWQGHNPEDTWLMVFVFESNRPVDEAKGIKPKPFRFIAVYGAYIMKEDWLFSGRSEQSRRTITASVMQSGYQKMLANWIYQDVLLNKRELPPLSVK